MNYTFQIGIRESTRNRVCVYISENTDTYGCPLLMSFWKIWCPMTRFDGQMVNRHFFLFFLFIIPLVCFVSCVCVCVSLYVYIALPWLSVATNPKNVCVQRNKKEKKRWRCDQFQMDVNGHAPRSLTWTMDYAVISFLCVLFSYIFFARFVMLLIFGLKFV